MQFYSPAATEQLWAVGERVAGPEGQSHEGERHRKPPSKALQPLLDRVHRICLHEVIQCLAFV